MGTDCGAPAAGRSVAGVTYTAGAGLQGAGLRLPIQQGRGYREAGLGCVHFRGGAMDTQEAGLRPVHCRGGAEADHTIGVGVTECGIPRWLRPGEW